jgi:hypothetical protein
VGLLAVYAWLHHSSRGAHRIALVMALGALGDMVLEVAFTAGAAAFLAGHLVAIALYLQHGRESVCVRWTRGWRSHWPSACRCWPGCCRRTGRWPCRSRSMPCRWAKWPRRRGSAPFRVDGWARGAYVCGVGPADLRAHGPLATSALPHLLIWPLYYFGQFLICTGVIATLRREGEFSAE